MGFVTISPENGCQIKEYEYDSDQLLNKKILNAEAAFREWRKTTIDQRANLISKIAVKLRTNKELYAKTISQEMGKVRKEALAEVEKCAWLCDYYSQQGSIFLADEPVQADGHKHFVRYEPLGIVLSIMPWNFPFWQAIRFGIPTILAGNSTILKHSNTVPECARHISELFDESDVPKGLFQYIYANHSQVSQLIENKMIKGISLTGSTDVGKQVAKQAAVGFKKVVLELGGSDPFIVCADADLDRAVEGAILGRFLNCGQSCIAAKRFLVDQKVYHQFLEKLKIRVEKLVVGPSWNDSTDIGPLINSKALNELETQFNDAISKGAKLICGGKRLLSAGHYWTPTIISEVTADMKIFSEEVFGPIAPVCSFDSTQQMIELANATQFGLGASVWSQDLSFATKIVEQIECGTVFVNSFVKSDPRMPFGGSKDSGLGRELAAFGAREFTNVKSFSLYQ